MTILKNFAASIEQKLKQCLCYTRITLAWLHHSFKEFLSILLHILLFQINSFWAELVYFIALSSLGFFALKFASKPGSSSFTPKTIDFFFTAVSAVTSSSMSTVEMEVFSNSQLLILTVFMFVGNKIFVSMIGLYLTRVKTKERRRLTKYETGSPEMESEVSEVKPETESEALKLKSIQTLTPLVSCYFILVQVVGSILIFVYISLVPSAKKVLNKKGLNLITFSIFTTVSTFANCGFVPTNENMMVFGRNSGLLLILIPQILMGNTLYPAFLRFAIFVLGKMTKKLEFRYMLENSRELGYRHLFSGKYSVYMAGTAVGLIIVQLIVFCSLDWNNSEVISFGLSDYQKLVASLFQVVNARHAGESVFGLSAVSPAVLVLYLPEYTSFLRVEEDEKMSTSERVKKKSKMEDFWELILFSQLSYLTIFTILICITEREQMKMDSLNFNVFNIIFEVISAYGNVGFSIGYSCKRQINDDGYCKKAWYGFAGRWSDGGKIVLIVVMFFGKLKKFSMRGGRAWTLSL
ncbi:probable cation transporter hkt6 [Phtheirospermum japonicum]|uniref:Probable cation transporter hkt6 n=1 Tax=Phtheirospermum japonicum TaxID=374723 RepID=A0A830CWH9_9LAMI|nr:probable cation transporter hkt6 [Phtheirospermum japonicum]